MKPIRLLLLIATVLIVSCTQQEKKCILSGVVINRPQSENILLTKTFHDLRDPDIARIPINDGEFIHEFSYSDIEAYKLVFEDEHSKGFWSPHYFFPTDGKVKVTLNDMDNENQNSFNGGKVNREYNNYKKNIQSKYYSLIESYHEKTDSLINIGKYESDTVIAIRELLANYASEGINGTEEKELLMQISTLRHENKDLTDEAKIITAKLEEKIQGLNSTKLAYIEKNQSIVTYFILMQCLNDRSENYDATYLEYLKECFIDKYKTHPYTHQLSQSILKVGEKYFDFRLRDNSGTPYNISDIIKGKFAIIDIWAPWCGSCLTKSRALKSIYDEFNDSNFEIVGISSKYYELEDVENVLFKETYPWITLIDQNDWQSEINTKYGIINAGGVTVMVDNAGVVLAINPTNDYIKKTLKENLN